MAVNMKEAMVASEDPAGKQIVGIIHKTVRLMLFTRTVNAQWAADQVIKQEAYPFSEVVIETNRDLFRYEVGDLFILPYARYGVAGIICRVLNIQEEDLLSEKIIVTAAEDPDYFGDPVPVADIEIPIGGGEPPGGGGINPVVPLQDFTFIEAPYVYSGDTIGILPLVGKEEGFETGYYVYMSIDGGSSYVQFENVAPYAVHGSLVYSYDTNTFDIDDTVGFQIDIEQGASVLQSIARSQLFTDLNLSVLGGGNYFEIITWQTITPISGNRYEITGVYRGRYGTEKIYHPAGTDFFFVSDNRTELLLDNEFVVGFTPYFKVVPYSSTSISSVDDAVLTHLTLEGYALEPYEPVNLSANGNITNATYSGGSDIVLDWDPRVRGDGLGLENPDYITDGAHEGYFEVQVVVGGSTVRTTTGIDTTDWTYTDAMNTTDNGTPASSILFKLRNYKDTGGVTYYSEWVNITVTKV
jgi:hypothetical protein